MVNVRRFESKGRFGRAEDTEITRQIEKEKQSTLYAMKQQRENPVKRFESTGQFGRAEDPEVTARVKEEKRQTAARMEEARRHVDEEEKQPVAKS